MCNPGARRRSAVVLGGAFVVAAAAAACGGAHECSPACRAGFECYYGFCMPVSGDADASADVPPDADVPRSDDGGADRPEAEDAGGCRAGEVRCSADATALETCVADGSGWTAAACPFDCASDPVPHCREWMISNVPDHGLLSAGETPFVPWNLPAEGDHSLVFDTAGGKVSLFTAEGAWLSDLRPEGVHGLHPESGIHFTTLTQDGGVPVLGVFSMQGLEVPANVTVSASGPNGLVLLVEEDAAIRGGVFVGCGGANGPPAGGAREAALGPGAGGDGSSVAGPAGPRDGGGGGGGFGGPGGNAGGFEPGMRGAPGAANGTPELVPLEAGSGGGWGGGDTVAGRRGGTSGGAVEIVAGGTLSVTGWVDARGCGGQSTYEGTNQGGGGGGSGGGILLEAPRVVVGGAITANGGGGGAGGLGAGDGTSDGADGSIGGSDPAPGGVQVSGFSCDGAAGAAGADVAGADAPTCDAFEDYNAGGGGGGAGRIRINGLERSVTGVVSPALDSGAATEGSLPLL